MSSKCLVRKDFAEMMDTDVEHSFRAAMRRHASGVGIVTTSHADRWFGMTATAIMSLSMDPPSLAMGINQCASMHDSLIDRQAFCVNLLHVSQVDVGDAFARMPSEDRFSAGDWCTDAASDLPYLSGAQAQIFCRLSSVVEFGTHSILIGEVLETRCRADIDPLLYVNGAFASHGVMS